MDNLKILIAESSYRQQLLKEISKVSNFDAVSETLYYEAVVTREYLKQENTEKETQGILDAFIKMCNVEKLTNTDMKSLMDKKVRPKSAIREYIIRGHIGEYLRIRAKLVLVFVISLLGFILPIPDLIIKPYLIITLAVTLGISTIMLLVDLLYLCVPVVRMLFSDSEPKGFISEGAVQALNVEVVCKRQVKNLRNRTSIFLSELPEGNLKLSLKERFEEAKPYTKDYYELCADIELAYFDFKKI